MVALSGWCCCKQRRTTSRLFAEIKTSRSLLTTYQIRDSRNGTRLTATPLFRGAKPLNELALYSPATADTDSLFRTSGFDDPPYARKGLGLLASCKQSGRTFALRLELLVVV